MHQDFSNGYDAVAQQFIAARSDTGVSVVTTWAETFRKGDTVLDCGCGHGIPITKVLIESGLEVSAIDASPKLVEAFTENFPNVPVTCEPVETSSFLDQSYDGILAVGLIFLLPEQAQSRVILNIAERLNPQGRLLFSAPSQMGAWTDILTNQQSVSLGQDKYTHLMKTSGLQLIGTHIDEGGNHYYEARKS